jgi:Ca2+ transporting ATPase
MLVDSVIKYENLNKLKEPSVHFTIIFNAFILMTLFNEFNARKLHDERNVFSGLKHNMYFIVIWLFCFVNQVIFFHLN